MKWGWLQNSIANVIASDLAILTGCRYALVTCVDSSAKLEAFSTAKRIVESEAASSILGNSLLIADARVADIAERYNLFNGFDEIWLYRERPKIDKPGGASIVAPTDLNVDPPSEVLLEWFCSTGCVLGLGDGIGMNFISVY